MYFISYYKCVAGEVGSYCQLAMSYDLFFLVSPYQTGPEEGKLSWSGH